MFEEFANIDEIEQFDGARVVLEKYNDIMSLMEYEFWRRKNQLIFAKGIETESEIISKYFDDHHTGVALLLALLTKLDLVSNPQKSKERVMRLIDNLSEEKRLLDLRNISKRNYLTAKYTLISTIIILLLTIITLIISGIALSR